MRYRNASSVPGAKRPLAPRGGSGGCTAVSSDESDELVTEGLILPGYFARAAAGSWARNSCSSSRASGARSSFWRS